MLKLFVLLVLISCGKKAHPNTVRDFDVNRYLGTWYEIARIDHYFEEGCVDVSATYIKRDDGGIDVLNKCMIDGKENIANGVAYFRGEQKNIGEFKVSFFGPFYGDYNIVYLDKDYNHTIILGDDESYMWILSRTKKLEKEVLDSLIKKAKKFGVKIENIVYSPS